MAGLHRSQLAISLGIALRSLPIYVRPQRSHEPGEVIAEPSRLGAKPTTYRPSPSNPPQSGKRRRQWR